ncbi:MAG: PIN domain-containing protein [Gemmatimonadetes bacterium]|nr:PIN domain-containing protein [Gemmatimonadota bacterium]
MNVLVDTSVWSLALRRATVQASPEVAELRELIREGRVEMVGAIRQELLSGVRDPSQFASLRDRLRAFPDLVLSADDHELAAECCNRCRAGGVQGSPTDFLLCAVALSRGFAILTTDGDFTAFARLLPLRLHPPRGG